MREHLVDQLTPKEFAALGAACQKVSDHLTRPSRPDRSPTDTPRAARRTTAVVLPSPHGAGRPSPPGRVRRRGGRPPYEAFSIDEIDALEALAEFEIEHRRILAMQTLFYKRRKAGGVA